MRLQTRLSEGVLQLRNIRPYSCHFCTTSIKIRTLSKQPLGARIWTRGAKRRSTIALKDVPQGALPRIPIETETSREPAYPTVIQQARNNMRKFSHCVLLTRVGGFYELYFEQAEEYAPLLNLKTGSKKTSVGAVPMAGFPYFQLDRFLKVLVHDLNKYVAISEEFANDPSQMLQSGGLLFDRRVTRIVTPGTLIDEKFMDPWENNFLLSIHADPSAVQSLEISEKMNPVPQADIGLSWVDLSSGDFFTQKTDFGSFLSIVARINPREIVVDRALETSESPLLKALTDEKYTISFQDILESTPAEKWHQFLEDTSIDNSAASFSECEVTAGNIVLHYANVQLQGSKVALQAPIQRQDNEFMIIDRHSLRALEIRETLRDGNFEGSLLHAVRRTVTKSGTRLLAQRLTAPSMDLDEINHRLDLVTEMIEAPALRNEIISLLRATYDSLRLVQKFAFGRGDTDDLLGLSKTVQITKRIAELLEAHAESHTSLKLSESKGNGKASIQKLLSQLNFDGPLALSQRILDAIDEEMLSEQHRIEDSQAAQLVELAEDVLSGAGEPEKLKGVPKGVKSQLVAGGARKETGAPEDIWIMKRSASKILHDLHDSLDQLLQEKEELTTTFREKSKTPGLTLKWTPGLGHICHIKGKCPQSALDALGATKRVSSSRTTQSFHLPEWTRLGTNIDDAKLRIRREEQRVFTTLRTLVIRDLPTLRRNACVLDSLDVATAFASLAVSNALTRPILDHSATHTVLGARHPVVEAGLRARGLTFTPNDCLAGPTAPARVLLITGPNMGGKSTFLRQNALISILAQTGSYVPAHHARLGLVDRVFSRVGAADDLFRDRSTFMVEMLEAGAILRGATRRSFVIMDEVGRGTTAEEGLAVGFACLWHLWAVNRCRGLFATHFHRIADLTVGWEGVGRLCSDVLVEGDGGFVYVHRLREGVNRESHALKVARVAGLPDEAIRVAARLLEDLKAEGPLAARGEERKAGEQG
ncbi:putative DNA mismatch repair protein Msh1 [Trichodelitschia bisporula]|uniref:Putative DNA mismatch repair protein Msh1 n=1 Tax=Trichodelitschia bisporula TaxID=703511 RepID=A0A6G1I763_9PEZI|nr:putative DNA mismatch repair protein Msh1 [Trichodelitschia bisporula]